MNYAAFFSQIPPQKKAHPWQETLGNDPQCRNRLIRIPTGFGKTLGILQSWIYHRLIRNDDTWPRRLIWCLPMRVLVEQTEAEVLKALGSHLWNGQGDHAGKVGVHTLMGGSEAGDWHLYPEECAVLIGTQDMLLSRALNRGYAAPRARWPMEFGLLNQDALWVMDEVQLMDVGLATSAQLQQFRQEDQAKSLRPCYTWWMSATLQPQWLESVDTKELVQQIPTLDIPAPLREGGLWEVTKPCQVKSASELKDIATWAKLIWDSHHASVAGEHGRITLAVANTVKTACELREEVEKLAKPKKGEESKVERRLVHSRFRPLERQQWREEFLRREACTSSTDRIIIATQVVEAGVDISATTLITEMAPWPSLVQRFGRAARYGGSAQVIVVNREAKDDKAAAPYDKDELDAAAEALAKLTDVSPKSLETFEAGLDHDTRAKLYPYDPMHLLLRREIEELFDTSPDLSGGDIDISRFIRSGEERDVLVFWRDVADKETPADNLSPDRAELCHVPFLAARKWLEKKKRDAWVWDYLDGAWKPCEAKKDIYPGQTLLVRASFGGYRKDSGWTGQGKDKGFPLHSSLSDALRLADAAENQEELSAFPWKTVRTHGKEVAAAAQSIATALDLPPAILSLLEVSGRWHDAGKVHPAFQVSIKADAPGKPAIRELAKAPKDAWEKGSKLYRVSAQDHRPGFRHELASAMALFGILQRHQPLHPALLGEHQELLELLGHALPATPADSQPNSAEKELLALSKEDFNLLAYLVCSHHGKVRASWHSSPMDQDYRDRDGNGLPIRGVRNGEHLPSFDFEDRSGHTCRIQEVALSHAPAALGLSPLTGASWTERVLDLLRQHGPFALAYLEALIRAADIRASKLDTSDPLLECKP